MSKATAKVPMRLAREKRVSHILSAARDVFCKKGYEQTRYPDTPRRPGGGRGTALQKFSTKHDFWGEGGGIR